MGFIKRRLDVDSCQLYILSRTSGLLSKGAHLDGIFANPMNLTNLANLVDLTNVAGVYAVYIRCLCFSGGAFRATAMDWDCGGCSCRLRLGFKGRGTGRQRHGWPMPAYGA